MEAAVVVALISLFGGLVASWVTYQQGKAQVRQELLVDYDRTLRAQRIEAYKGLIKCMKQLPKYPEPLPLTYTELRALGDGLTTWYFDEAGGLFLSTESRDAYFDLQDGIKVLLRKQAGVWEAESDQAALRKVLERNDDWKCPPRLLEIVNAKLEPSTDRLPLTLIENLRLLASALRTSITNDLMSRRTALLQLEDLRASFDRSTPMF